MEKILTLKSLIKIRSTIKNKKVVLCHGVFDLLHLGHIRHFKEAKSLGDFLIVSITPDKFVEKGPGRPIFNERLRAEALSHINEVDAVLINSTETASFLIKKIKPNIYCKGPDYRKNSDDVTGEIKNEIKAIKSVGGKVYYTKSITFSSSKLINQYGSVQSDPQKQFLKKFNVEYEKLSYSSSPDEVIKATKFLKTSCKRYSPLYNLTGKACSSIFTKPFVEMIREGILSKEQATELKLVGGLFRNKSKKGDVYYSGKGEDGTQYVLFRNAYWKEGEENKPYFRLHTKVPKGSSQSFND